MGNTILGVKYISHDTAAALMRDGKIIAACEQERYTLDKHSRLFPIDAVRDCLKMGESPMMRWMKLHLAAIQKLVYAAHIWSLRSTILNELG